jgi:hypothetical protein
MQGKFISNGDVSSVAPPPMNESEAFNNTMSIWRESDLLSSVINNVEFFGDIHYVA